MAATAIRRQPPTWPCCIGPCHPTPPKATNPMGMSWESSAASAMPTAGPQLVSAAAAHSTPRTLRAESPLGAAQHPATMKALTNENRSQGAHGPCSFCRSTTSGSSPHARGTPCIQFPPPIHRQFCGPSERLHPGAAGSRKHGERSINHEPLSDCPHSVGAHTSSACSTVPHTCGTALGPPESTGNAHED
jgi:hypothetical protein